MPQPPPVSPFSPEDTARIQGDLNRKLDRTDLSYRPSPAGNVAYVEGWRSFNLANEVFGFSGWSSEILQIITDFCECDGTGRVSVGISCMVRVYLRDGTFHDDIGYGSSEGIKSKAAAFEKAKKEAVTDAMKRALRVYGNRLGNCAYDKAFLKEIKCSSGGTTHGAQPAQQQQQQSTQQKPQEYIPAWLPARTALNHSAKLAGNQNTRPDVNMASRPQPHDMLHSDDFDALITEADLYDLETLNGT